MSDNDDLKCKSMGNKLFKKQRAALSKAKMNEPPSGAAIPKAPSPPKPPSPPVAPGNSPAGQAAKQSQQAAKGAAQTPKIPQAPKIKPMGKSEKRSELKLSETELYTNCEHCGTPQFSKTAHGPEYAPCACFMVTKTEKFVTLKKSDTGYTLDFDPKADPESVRAFLLALKAKLLVTKRFGAE